VHLVNPVNRQQGPGLTGGNTGKIVA